MSHFLELLPPIFIKLFDNIQEPVSILENGVFVECNQATLTMLNLDSKEDLIGKTPWAMSPEFQSDGVSSVEKSKVMIGKCIAEGTSRFDWEHKRAGGSSFVAEIILTAIPEMEVETVFVAWRDVTSKIEAIQAIKEMQTKYETITENSPTAMLIHQHGMWVYANKAVEEIFHMPREQVIGEDFFRFVHPSQKSQIIENAKKRMAGEFVPDRYDVRIETPAGEERWLDAKFSIIDLNGEKAILLNGLDITKRVEAERNLRESMERYKATLTSIGEGVIAVDESGLIQMMNPVAEMMTGWKLTESKGKPLDKIFNISNAFTSEVVESPAVKVLRIGEIVGFANHTVLKSRDGREYYIADSGAPIKDELGKIRGVVLVFRDVTEKYIIEEQMKNAQKMEAVGQLASGLAHDFNNILAGIIGSAEIISDFVKGNQEAEMFVDKIKEAAMNANNLTRQLLDFSRKPKKEIEKIEMNALISSTIDFVKASIGDKIEIKAEYYNPKAIIIGNKTQIQNAMINLIFNARDSMPEGGIIKLSVSEHEMNGHSIGKLLLPPGKYVKLSVLDTGSGIDEGIVSRIFDPYFTTKPAGKGTGLGLAMVQKTVAEHKGTVLVTSEPGKGSTFEIYLPFVNNGEL